MALMQQTLKKIKEEEVVLKSSMMGYESPPAARCRHVT